MSEKQTTQTAVDETKVSATPDTKVESARETDDLDKLLSEYDEGAPKPLPTPPEQKTGTDDSKVVLEQIKGFVAEQQGRQYRQDMDATIAKVRGNLDPEFFDAPFVEAYLDGQARQDPRLAQAWANRQASPKQFERVVDQLGRNFAKKYGKLPDKQATEDREAVTAAVRGASTKAPDGKAPDFAGMQNGEFNKAVKEQYGFDPGI